MFMLCKNVATPTPSTNSHPAEFNQKFVGGIPWGEGGRRGEEQEGEERNRRGRRVPREEWAGRGLRGGEGEAGERNTPSHSLSLEAPRALDFDRRGRRGGSPGVECNALTMPPIRKTRCRHTLTICHLQNIEFLDASCLRSGPLCCFPCWQHSICEWPLYVYHLVVSVRLCLASFAGSDCTLQTEHRRRGGGGG